MLLRMLKQARKELNKHGGSDRCDTGACNGALLVEGLVLDRLKKVLVMAFWINHGYELTLAATTTSLQK